MDLWEIYKASKGVPHSGDLYDALMGKALGGAGSVWELETAPYLFRQSGGLLNSRLLGKEKDCIVGASVGFNQLFGSNASITVFGITANYTNGKLTLSGTPTSVNGAFRIYVPNRADMPSGHKFLVSGASTHFGIRPQGYSYSTSSSQKERIFISGDSVISDIVVNFLGLDTATEYNETIYPQFYDLTLMFGSTIADYAYTLETQQTGKGVAWLKDYGFFSEYFAFDGGSIKSVSGLVSHKMVGKNLLDYGNTITIGDPDPAVIKDLYIPATCTFSFKASADYVNSNNYWLVYLEQRSGTKTYITPTAGQKTTKTLYATIDNPIIRIYIRSIGITAGTVSELQIELGSTATDYAPYHTDTYPLDTTVELRGLFKMDADHNLYAEGDTYESSGVVSRKYAQIVFDGSSDEGWFLYGYGGFGIGVSGIKRPSTSSEIANIISNKFIAENYTDMGNNARDFAMACHYTVDNMVFYNASITTVEAWRTWLSSNPITLVYELATPTTDQAEPFTSPQNVDKAGTEEYVTTQKFVPIGHETQYKCTPTP